jgi:hypothetical protein
MQSLILALAALVLGGSPSGVHAESGAAEFDDSCHKGTFSSETYFYSNRSAFRGSEQAASYRISIAAVVWVGPTQLSREATMKKRNLKKLT